MTINFIFFEYKEYVKPEELPTIRVSSAGISFTKKMKELMGEKNYRLAFDPENNLLGVKPIEGQAEFRPSKGTIGKNRQVSEWINNYKIEGKYVMTWNEELGMYIGNKIVKDEGKNKDVLNSLKD